MTLQSFFRAHPKVALERFLDGGALDVYSIPIGMKKNRPGTLLRVMCREEDRERILSLFFRYTSTIGVRETQLRRYTLQRSVSTQETPWGPVRRKVSCGYGVSRSKYEYEDLARIARERQISIADAAALLDKGE